MSEEKKSELERGSRSKAKNRSSSIPADREAAKVMRGGREAGQSDSGERQSASFEIVSDIEQYASTILNQLHTARSILLDDRFSVLLFDLHLLTAAASCAVSLCCAPFRCRFTS